MKIKYILSAFESYFQVSRIAKKDGGKIVNDINKLVQIVHDKTKDIEISFLMNAFTEKNIIEKYKDHFQKLESDMFHDSGGLQMVTLGLNKKGLDISKAKMEVYETQAKYADYGMSFDEIPKLKINDGRDYGAGMELVTIKGLYKEKGELANKNLLDHLNVFKKMETKCKVLPILQTFNVKEGMDYGNALFANITPDLQKYIGGISLGGLTHDGFLSLLQPTYVAMKLDNSIIEENRKKLIHYLGVGSIKRMIPIILLYKNGVIDSEYISVDSSRLVKIFDQGSVDYYDEKNRKLISYENLGKDESENVKFIHRKTWELFSTVMKDTYDSFEDFCNYSYHWGKKAKEIRKNKWNCTVEEEVKIRKTRLFISFLSIYANMMLLHDILNGNLKPETIFKISKDKQVIHLIDTVTDLDRLQYIIDKYYQPNLRYVDNMEQFENLQNPLKDWI